MPVGQEVIADEALAAGGGGAVLRAAGAPRQVSVGGAGTSASRFRRKQRQGRSDHVSGIANCLARRRFQNRLPREARRLDANIGGQNHNVCLFDIFIGEYPLFSSGALRLHLDLMTKRRGNLFQGFGRHDVCALCR